jgi:hypothetical protein
MAAGTAGIGGISPPDEIPLACIDANPVLATRMVSDHPNPDLFLDRLAASLPRSAERLRLLAD